MIFERNFHENPIRHTYLYAIVPIIDEKGEIEFKKSIEGVFLERASAIEHIRSHRRKISIPRYFRGYKPIEVRERFFKPQSPWGNPRDFLAKHPEVCAFLTTYEVR